MTVPGATGQQPASPTGAAQSPALATLLPLDIQHVFERLPYAQDIILALLLISLYTNCSKPYLGHELLWESNERHGPFPMIKRP